MHIACANLYGLKMKYELCVIAYARCIDEDGFYLLSNLQWSHLPTCTSTSLIVVRHPKILYSILFISSTATAGVGRRLKNSRGQTQFFRTLHGLQNPNLRGPMIIYGVQSSECCPMPTWWRFLGFLCHHLFIYKVFCIDNDKFWCEQLGKGFRHSLSRKIQGVHGILIGPIGQFQSVTEGVQTVQRGSLDAQAHNNATLGQQGSEVNKEIECDSIREPFQPSLHTEYFVSRTYRVSIIKYCLSHYRIIMLHTLI